MFFDLFTMLMRLAYTKRVKELKKWSESIAAFGREKQKRFLTYMHRTVRDISQNANSKMVFFDIAMQTIIFITRKK